MGVQWQCATAGASSGQGFKMAGLSRTGATGDRFEQVTYGFFCHQSAERAFLVNYGGFGSGGGSSYNTGLTPAGTFLDGVGWGASDVFSMEVSGSTMLVSPRV